MSTCTCYICDGTGETADGYDDQYRSRSTTCRHCGGTGQEPEGKDPEDRTAPPDESCASCKAPNCPTRNDPTVVWCAGFRRSK